MNIVHVQSATALAWSFMLLFVRREFWSYCVQCNAPLCGRSLFMQQTARPNTNLALISHIV